MRSRVASGSRTSSALNDGSAIFSTYVGLYHLTTEAGSAVIKPIHFLKPGAYTGFGPLFQDNTNLIYVKTLGDSLYVLKPGSQGKEFNLIKSIRFIPTINQYFNEKGDSIIYLATNDGLVHLNSNDFRIEEGALQ